MNIIYLSNIISKYLDINKILKIYIDYKIIKYLDMQHNKEHNNILIMLKIYLIVILEKIIKMIYYYQVLELVHIKVHQI